MFKHILVPLDGSPFAESALVPACTLAHAYGSELLLTRAIPLAKDVVPGDAAEIALTLNQTQHADDYLSSVAERLRGEGYSARSALFVSDPLAGITTLATLGHADLIVMTSHLRWQPTLNKESVTLEALAHVSFPFLIWRPFLSWRDLPSSVKQPPLPTPLASPDAPIVVALDGSPFAERALPYAQTLALTFHAPLLLVRVVSQHKANTLQDTPAAAHRSSPRAGDRLLHMADAYLAQIRQSLIAQGVEARALARVGKPFQVIEALWRQEGAGLIVLATHGQRGRPPTWLGSLAERLITEVEAPLLVIPPVR